MAEYGLMSSTLMEIKHTENLALMLVVTEAHLSNKVWAYN